MPTYDYRCTTCGEFSAVRRIADRDLPAVCPGCAAESPRVLFAMPMLGNMDTQSRAAHALNERSAHAPQSSRDYQRLRHVPGCGCCSGGKRAAARELPNGARTFPGRRPWQISH